MSKKPVSSFVFASVQRTLKAAPRIGCEIDTDGNIYVYTGAICYRMTSAQYDFIARPVTLCPAGNFTIRDGQREDTASAYVTDLFRKTFQETAAIPALTVPDLTTHQGKTTISGLCADDLSFVALFDHALLSTLRDVMIHSTSALNPAMAYNADGPVALIMPMNSESEATVLSDFAHLRRTHRPDNEIPALSGKYAALRNSLRAARAAGLAAAARVPDGGTCNLDSPAISLPRWRSALVEEAARQAGCGCYRWSTSGSVYVFPLHTPGQANKRETAAETATAYLQSQGYDALTYSQID